MKYFYWEMPSPALLLRISDTGAHQIFAKNEWSETTLLMEYFAGERHDVEPIAEQSAREQFPAAF